MNGRRESKTILAVSLPLSALIIVVSIVGFVTPGFYSSETLNWRTQSLGQDMIDLFLVAPCLLITSIISYRNNKTATAIWGGIVLYLTYTFVIYCFDVHFNRLFLLYCICLGLSFYSVIYFLFTHLKENQKIFVENKLLVRITGIYFIIIAVLFYLLWMSEIVPAILRNAVPKSVVEAGLFTNAVQVIDLSVVLPGIFIIGICMLKRTSTAFILVPFALTFFIFMDITIGAIAVVMNAKGVQDSLAIVFVMALLAMLSLALLVWYVRSLKS
jgi:hypothetical protein